MTDDLSQCGNCIYHYTYNGRDMCKQVGDDFYLQWKVENCPYHTSITKVAAISDEIYRLKAENASLRERLEKVLELPVPLGTPVLKVWRNRVPTDDTRMDFVDMWEITTVSFKLEYYTLWGKQYFHNTEEGRKAAEARLEELKG